MDVTAQRAEEAVALQETQRHAFGPALHALRALIEARQEGRARDHARRFASYMGADDEAAEALFTVAREAPVKHWMDGETIVAEGDTGNDVYVIRRGQVQINRAGAGVVARMGVGQSFGEIAAFAHTPRTASVVAEGNTSCILVTRKLLGRLTRRARPFDELLRRLYRNRILAQLIGQGSVFGALSSDQRHALFARFEPRSVAKGTKLVREGELGTAFHVIVSGRAVVYRERASASVAKLGPGDVFGEVALIRGGCTTATVETIEPMTCFVLHREAFRALIDPEARALLEAMAEEHAVDAEAEATEDAVGADSMTDLDDTVMDMPALDIGTLPPRAAPLEDVDATVPVRVMTCPSCGFDQVEAPVCIACGVDILAERAAFLAGLPVELTRFS